MDLTEVNAIRYSLSQILLITKLKLKDDKESAVSGIRMKVEGFKTRFTKPFQKVTVEVHPLRDGTKGGGLRKITFAGGKSCTYNIRDQERPNLEGDSLCK